LEYLQKCNREPLPLLLLSSPAQPHSISGDATEEVTVSETLQHHNRVRLSRFKLMQGYSSSIPVSGSLQEMTEQCAAYQAGITGGNGVFAIWPGGNTCYADITFPPNQPADCDSAGAIIADYSQ
jgi:hypothetical protein